MLHRNRTWCRGKPRTPDELAQMLTKQTWTLCSAFEVEGSSEYLFLNDSTSENNAQVYAVVKQVDGGFRQIESIAFSWCSYELALRYIESVIEGGDDNNVFAHDVRFVLESPDEHGSCPLCA